MAPTPDMPPPPDLTAIYGEHRAFVTERLRCLGVPAADLDDATQDVFTVLVRRIADYDPRYAPQGWLAGISRKVARKYRERGNRVVLSLDEARVSAEHRERDSVERLEAEVVRSEFLRELEAERWAVFVLSEVEGLRGSEIAAELGVNQNTVYARLRSARNAFERKLAAGKTRQHAALPLLGLGIFGERRPTGRPTGWIATLAVAVSLSAMALFGVLAVRCGAVAPQDTDARTAAKESVAPPVPAPAPRSMATSAAAQHSSAGWFTDRSQSHGVNAQPAANDNWVSLGSANSWRLTSDGDGILISYETRYRIDGDRITVETSYAGDPGAAMDDVSGGLELENFELLDGEAVWSFSLPAGGTHTVRATARALLPGAALFIVRGGAAEADLHIYARLELVLDGGELRKCAGAECPSNRSTAAEDLSGHTVSLNVANHCQIAARYVVSAGTPIGAALETLPIHTLKPGEQTRVTIDKAQAFFRVADDGSLAGSVSTTTPDAWIEFFGKGDTCDELQASELGGEDDDDQPPF